MYINHSPKRITIKGYKRDDCTVNAIGSALGLSYDLARKILQTGKYYNGEFTFAKSKPRTKLQFTERNHVKRICAALSVDSNVYISDEQLSKLNGRAPRRTKNNTLAKFAEDNPNGIFIVLVKGHLTTVIDGKIIDRWDSSQKVVEIVYRIDVNKARNTIAELASFYRMDSQEHILRNHVKSIMKSA